MNIGVSAPSREGKRNDSSRYIRIRTQMRPQPPKITNRKCIRGKLWATENSKLDDPVNPGLGTLPYYIEARCDLDLVSKIFLFTKYSTIVIHRKSPLHVNNFFIDIALKTTLTNEISPRQRLSPPRQNRQYRAFP
jgi:hypothetical protein